MVVSNIFYFHPYLGKWSNLTNIFFKGLKPLTRQPLKASKLQVYDLFERKRNAMQEKILEMKQFQNKNVLTLGYIREYSTLIYRDYIGIQQRDGKKGWYTTWRIIPVSKWLVTPIYKPIRPFGRGITLHRKIYGCFQKYWYPKIGWGLYWIENPIKMDDLG